VISVYAMAIQLQGQEVLAVRRNPKGCDGTAVNINTYRKGRDHGQTV
jgi:hypothetical protein